MAMVTKSVKPAMVELIINTLTESPGPLHLAEISQIVLGKLGMPSDMPGHRMVSEEIYKLQSLGVVATESNGRYEIKHRYSLKQAQLEMEESEHKEATTLQEKRKEVLDRIMDGNIAADRQKLYRAYVDVALALEHHDVLRGRSVYDPAVLTERIRVLRIAEDSHRRAVIIANEIGHFEDALMRREDAERMMRGREHLEYRISRETELYAALRAS